jgi:hypothetical protein
MSWLATVGVALVAALAGMLTAGFTASLAVSWYRIPSFEGQSGYFVVFLALVGLVSGFVMGIVVARTVNGGFLHGTAAALAAVFGLTLLVGGSARLLADVPPKIGGDTLLLALEYRWPASHAERPLPGEDEPYIRLGAVRAHVERRAATGAFWLEDARREDGRWIAPAAVQVFTERGRRVVSFIVDDRVLGTVMVPLPRNPDATQLEWSSWLPADASGSADAASYRYRVHRSSEPIRVERFGPFEVEMRAPAFWLAEGPDGRGRVEATAVFTIRHQGEPVAVELAGTYGDAASEPLERALTVAAVGAPRPALLACMDRYDRPCFLLVSEEYGVRTEFMGTLEWNTAGYELTADPARFELARGRTWLRSRLQRDLFERGSVYLLGAALLDTNGPRVLLLPDDPELSVHTWGVPPGLSPDGRAFIRLGSDADGTPVLIVSDVEGGKSYALPIDTTRTRYDAASGVTPTWVMDHFEWVRASDGTFRLAERYGVLPLPGR